MFRNEITGGRVFREILFASKWLKLILGGALLLIGFQNCDPGFHSSSSGVAGPDFCVQVPGDASCLLSLKAVCRFNGKNIAEGESVAAYQNSSVPFGSSCQSENRTCHAGALSGSYQYADCAVGAAKACLFNGVTVPSGGQVKAFLTSTVPAGQTCSSQMRACTDGVLSGNYLFSDCQPGAFASCYFDGRTIAHGDVVVAFVGSQVPYGQTCQPQSRTCYNGALSGVGEYSHCEPAAPVDCTFNNATVKHGASVTAFFADAVPYGQSCQSEVRTCSNGTLSGSAPFVDCKPKPPASCNFAGSTIPDGGTVQAFASATVPYGQACVPQTRTCHNGQLSGSGDFAKCDVQPGASCLFDGRNLASGQSTTAFEQPTVAFGQTCDAKTITCTNGQLSGTARYGSCVVGQPLSCAINGRTIPHSGQITLFFNEHPDSLGNCPSEIRTCNNGQLSGSATFNSCAPVPATVNDLDQGDPMSWLLKSVCVDNKDGLLSADPWQSCVSGHMRKIRVAEPLPFFNYDRFSSQWNNFPVRTAAGQTLIINARQFGPNFDHQFRSQDQFDVYVTNVNGDGWVSASNTRDGGGYNTTFFGPNCAVGGGWLLFPIKNFTTGAITPLTIAGNYWQQSGQAFPGNCSSVPATPAQSEHRFLKDFAFGGVNGGIVKKMDAIQTIHGFEPNSGFLQAGHLEIFYFTREYGLTRWEVWTPTAQNPTKDTSRCANLPALISYQGVNFVVTDCHDNADVVPSNIPYLPVLPVPNMNMLQHANFDSAGGYLPATDSTLRLWHRGGISPAGNLINWSLLVSKAARDVAYAPSNGINYMATNCGAGNDGLCGIDMSPPSYQEIYQDIPISDFVSAPFYSYGISARVALSSGPQGKVMVGIQQLDSSGQVLWNDNVIRTIGNDEGNWQDASERASPFLSSAFVYKRVAMPIQPGAARVRFFFSPLTPQTFEVVEAWLAPW